MGRRRIAGKNLRIVSFNLDYDDLIKFEQILSDNQSASEVIREFIRTRIEEHELEQNLNQLTNRRNAIGVQYNPNTTPELETNQTTSVLSSLDIMNLTTLQILEIVNSINDTDLLLELETKCKTIMKTSNKLRMQAVNYRIYQRKLSLSQPQ